MEIGRRDGLAQVKDARLEGPDGPGVEVMHRPRYRMEHHGHSLAGDQHAARPAGHVAPPVLSWLSAVLSPFDVPYPISPGAHGDGASDHGDRFHRGAAAGET